MLAVRLVVVPARDFPHRLPEYFLVRFPYLFPKTEYLCVILKEGRGRLAILEFAF